MNFSRNEVNREAFEIRIPEGEFLKAAKQNKTFAAFPISLKISFYSPIARIFVDRSSQAASAIVFAAASVTAISQPGSLMKTHKLAQSLKFLGLVNVQIPNSVA